MKIAIGTPHAGVLTPAYVESLAACLADRRRAEWVLMLAGGCYVHKNRNALMRLALDAKVDFLLMVDTDMCWRPEDVFALVALGKDVAGGLYCLRDHPDKAEAYKAEGGQLLTLSLGEESPGPFTVDACGTGFLLLSQRVVAHALRPEVVAAYGLPFDLRAGLPPDAPPLEVARAAEVNRTLEMDEDLGFAARLRLWGVKVWIHPGVRPGHLSTPRPVYFGGGP